MKTKNSALAGLNSSTREGKSQGSLKPTGTLLRKSERGREGERRRATEGVRNLLQALGLVAHSGQLQVTVTAVCV
ncbi:hypothetical protein JZ751_001421 [Albula glossodonta]|uniref:Uncharacterized protein n=1 Tax=Albula glossodonta TaxID=121402 RepID=A0A8T2PTX5_9TELE|nr:hypothetical protein JZ751_001421 [Albula glossodonta]